MKKNSSPPPPPPPQGNGLAIKHISIAHRIKNPLRRTSEHIAILYFQTFTYHIIRMVQE